MDPRRVLIVNIRSLLMEGVEGLLESKTNGKGKFEVISTLADNLDDLIREVDQLNPSVILVDEIAASFEPVQLIAALLNTQCIRLIVLNGQTSKMDIYDKSEFMISNPNHLIDALDYREAPSSF